MGLVQPLQQEEYGSPTLLFQSCTCRGLAVLLSEAVPEVPLASSESQGGSWYPWGRGGVLGWCHSFREHLIARSVPAWLILRTASLATGGDKARKEDGSKQSVVFSVCLEDARGAFSSFQCLLQGLFFSLYLP